MNNKNFTNKQFTDLPSKISQSNFTECVFYSPSLFDRCNLKKCTFNAPTKFLLSNVIMCEFNAKCDFEKSNIIDELDEEYEKGEI